MADFMKKLKSVFIVVEETEPESSDQQETPPADTATSQPKGTVPPSVSEGKVNEKFVGVLFEAMSQNNPDGFDYLEFKQSLKSLEKMPMDEATRYQSAYAMAQTMGVNAAKLVETANHYLNILHSENQKFGEAVNKQRLQQIGNREEQIAQLDKAIKDKSAMIAKLTQEMDQHAKEMEKLKDEITQSTVKVESTKNDFTATFQTITQQIVADIENIKKYLK